MVLESMLLLVWLIVILIQQHFSINEGSQSITAEVRIQDVINSDDIAIYWELAGGLTMANILHGSANTIGGQNAVIKIEMGR